MCEITLRPYSRARPLLRLVSRDSPYHRSAARGHVAHLHNLPNPGESGLRCSYASVAHLKRRSSAAHAFACLRHINHLQPDEFCSAALRVSDLAREYSHCGASARNLSGRD